MNDFSYFYREDSDLFSFIRVPKVLFRHGFKKLSSDSKLLYGLLLDRMSLSKKNQWFDSENRVYIIYTIDEICEDFNVSNKTAGNLLKQLEDFGLIEKKRQGLSKPNILFLKNFNSIENSAVSLENTLKCKKYTSRDVKNTCQEVYFLHSNNTDINNNIYNNQSIINNKELFKGQQKSDRENEYINLLHKFRDKINYEYNIKNLHEIRVKQIDELLEIAISPYLDSKLSIKVNNKLVKNAEIRKSLEKFNYAIIRDILEKNSEIKTSIKNPSRYYLTMIYNSCQTAKMFSEYKHSQVANGYEYGDLMY